MTSHHLDIKLQSMEQTNKFISFIEKYYYYFLFFILAVLAFTCFFNLGADAIYSWDEARHGVNSFEMIMNNNYIANYYNGEIDYWNLKPPISYYLIIFAYKIFGYNAFALRFFSALSYFILALLVSLFVKKQVGKFESLISLLMFLSCYVFFFTHYIRTGDADALFILFFGVSFISLYLSSKSSNWLHLTAFMFAMAFLTKSWHAFIILPITFFYLIFTKGFKNIKWWQYITICLCAIIPILIWFLARYSFDGLEFFKQMIYCDLLNRSSNSIEGHNGYPFFYLINISKNFILLFCIIIFATAIIIKIKNKERLTNLDKICIISFISILTIFAIAKTKLEWYTYPISIPLIISGATYLGQFLKNINLKKLYKIIASATFCVLFIAGFTLVNIEIFKVDTDKLQVFIAEMPYQPNTTVYYQDENTTGLTQAHLLCFEWKTNRQLEKGGYQEFILTNNSNIIMSKSYYNILRDPNLEIIFEDENYVLCKQS